MTKKIIKKGFNCDTLIFISGSNEPFMPAAQSSPKKIAENCDDTLIFEVVEDPCSGEPTKVLVSVSPEKTTTKSTSGYFSLVETEDATAISLPESAISKETASAIDSILNPVSEKVKTSQYFHLRKKNY